MMENWEEGIKNWEGYFGATPKLTEFFSLPKVKKFVKDFRPCGGATPDPEALAFLFFFVVLVERKWRTMPSRADLKGAATDFKNARMSFLRLQKNKYLTDSEEMSFLADKLLPLEQRIKAELKAFPSVLIGNARICVRNPLPTPSKDYARRLVVFFWLNTSKIWG